MVVAVVTVLVAGVAGWWGWGVTDEPPGPGGERAPFVARVAVAAVPVACVVVAGLGVGILLEVAW